jgi:tetratricopeptide (TPR) repeat protein
VLIVAAMMAVGLAAAAQDNITPHLQAGLSLLKSGNLRQAEAEFQKALKLDPGSARVYVLLGITENGLKEYSEAISVFDSALKLDSNSVSAHYNLALSLLHLHRDDDAIHELEEVVQLDPKVEPAFYNLGLLLAQKGRFKESIQYLQEARRQQPADPAVIVNLVKAYFRIGQKEKAIELAKQGINEDTRGHLSARLGILLVDEGAYNEALPALEKNQIHASQSASLAVYLAKAYLGTNQPTRAIKLLQQFESGSTSWEIYDLLGLAYQASGQPVLAKRAFQQAVTLKPASADAHFHLGKALLQSSEASAQKAGEQQILQAISLDPRETDYYETLGQWMLEKHRLQAANELLERGIQSTLPSPEIYLMLAIAKIQLDGAAAAKPFVERAIALNPQDGATIHLLGSCYFVTGDYLEAAKYFEKAITLSPQDAFFFYDAAMALERLNRVNEAIPFAEKAVRLDPNQAIYHYALGKLYEKIGRQIEAVRELETCVRLNPQIDYPYYLLARTYMRMGDPKNAHYWSQKLQQLKETKDSAAGLAPPASGSSQIVGFSGLLGKKSSAALRRPTL